MRIAALLAITPVLMGVAPAAALDVHVEGLRSVDGAVRLCLTRDPALFPDCKADPQAVKLSAPAAAAGDMRLATLRPGTYALSVIHDENGNGRLDRFARVPREGFGFSNNPAIRFGPPLFSEVRFEVERGQNDQKVRIRYLL